MESGDNISNNDSFQSHEADGSTLTGHDLRAFKTSSSKNAQNDQVPPELNANSEPFLVQKTSIISADMTVAYGDSAKRDDFRSSPINLSVARQKFKSDCRNSPGKVLWSPKSNNADLDTENSSQTPDDHSEITMVNFFYIQIMYRKMILK